LSEIPDLLRGIDGVGIVSVHYAGVVEHDIYTAPGVEVVNKALDIGLLGDVANLELLVWGAVHKVGYLTLISTLWADGTSCFSLARAFSRAAPEISAIKTFAPSLAKRIQVSRPIPLQVVRKAVQTDLRGRIQGWLQHRIGMTHQTCCGHFHVTIARDFEATKCQGSQSSSLLHIHGNEKSDTKECFCRCLRGM